MTQPPENIPAFPVRPNESEAQSCHQGMTLRDYFAAKAMQGMMPLVLQNMLSAHQPESEMDFLPKRAYEIADAMLLERSKK